MVKKNLAHVSFLIMIISLLGCDGDSENSFLINGNYQGNEIYKVATTGDTVLAVSCNHSFLDNGLLVYSSSFNQEQDTADWYFNESSEIIVIEKYFFFGISINDIIKLTSDSLVYEGIVKANIDGTSRNYIRRASFERID